MTNADKFRALSNEYLAYILYSLCLGSSCRDCPLEPFCGSKYRKIGEWLDWLGSEAEE